MLRPLLAALAVAAATPAFAEGQCVALGQWVGPDGLPRPPAAILAEARNADVVLLGEQHATPAHHRWQRDTIAALAESRPVVIGLEQLPRAAQPALDAFIAGSLDEAGFLAASRWKEVWGHDFAAYRPIFDLARQRAIPMVALNVDRAFVRKVGREGFTAAAAAGAPIARPAQPPTAYGEKLHKVFLEHAKAATPEALARFVEAQTVWDRAMAEGLAQALKQRPGAQAVAIMGHGHVEYGHGVEHQLADLGLTRIFSAIPVPATPPCTIAPDAADALHGTG